MRKVFPIIFLFSVFGTTYAQNLPLGQFVPTVVRYNGPPPANIPCPINQLALDQVNAIVYFCGILGFWQQYSGGAGTINGSIANQQIAFGSGPNAIQGNNSFTFDGSNLLLTSTTLGSSLFNPAIFTAQYNNSGTNSQTIGLFGVGRNIGAGTVTRLAGINGQAHNNSSGTVTEMDDFVAGTNPEPGTIGTYVGFRIQNQNAIGASIAFGEVFDNGLNAICIGSGTSTSPTCPAISSLSGTPNAAVTAQIGSTFWRTDGSPGSTLYVKESGAGNTGWDPVETSVASGTTSVTASNTVGCVDQTATATGATTAMKVVVSPVSPQTNTIWAGYVSSTNNVDIHVCTIVALTGSAVTYNWSVIP
jgi:hypothetical protein